MTITSCTLIFSALALFGARLSVTQQHSTKTEQTPSGWHVLDTKGKDPASQLTCNVHYGDELYTWVVSSSGENVTLGHPGSARVADSTKRIVSMHGLSGLASELEVDGGKLIGLDGGEFGGGLWFSPSNSSEQVQLLPQADVRAIIAVPRGALILTGSTSLVGDFATVYLVTGGSSQKWTLTPIVSLGATPLLTIRNGSHSSFILTSRSLIRLDDDGQLKLLGTLPAELRPNSVARDGKGNIYVGMTFTVFRFRRKGDGYIPEALVPNSCNLHQYVAGDGFLHCGCTQ